MKFKLKDPGSAITHGIGMLLAVAGATPLIVKAARSADVLHVFAVSVFILTMILLYLASTLYHSVSSTAKVNRRNVNFFRFLFYNFPSGILLIIVL